VKAFLEASRYLDTPLKHALSVVKAAAAWGPHLFSSAVETIFHIAGTSDKPQREIFFLG
jgi:hypothetical protein